MPSNPYASPAASSLPRTPAADSSHGLITEDIVLEFEKGQPWMRFLAILGFVAAAFQAIAGVVLLAFATNAEIPGGSLIGLFYLLGAAMYFAIFSRLSNSATAIKKIRLDGAAALAQVARHQSSLWKMIGMLSLLMVLLIAIIVFVGITTGINL